MTDAVDKVGDEQRAGNNRIQMPSFLNRYCAPDSYLDSMLLIRPSKNVYRQHRSKADMTPTTANVGFVPCVDGSRLASQNFTSQRWSVQPCVRPVDAVHMTAGHNALRGSGPGQKPAFDDALAHVGCPDRRIDRLCITCCLPFPTFTSRRMADAISFMPQARRVPCSARPWPSSPRPSAQSCWRAR